MTRVDGRPNGWFISRTTDREVYLLALVIAVFTLPVVALGPDLLRQVVPVAGPVLLIVMVLTTMYRLAPPHTLPWRRLVPGGVLAMVEFVASATGLRVYIAVLTSTGYTCGALATPIAFAVRVPAGARTSTTRWSRPGRPGRSPPRAGWTGCAR